METENGERWELQDQWGRYQTKQKVSLAGLVGPALPAGAAASAPKGCGLKDARAQGLGDPIPHSKGEKQVSDSL